MRKSRNRRTTGNTSRLEVIGVNGWADPQCLLLVHGRDMTAANAVRKFLESCELRAFTFEDLIAVAKTPAPFIGVVLEKALQRVQGVVVILTGDEEVKLKPHLRLKGEPKREDRIAIQSRPNVFFEAGMAMALMPEHTVIIQLDNVRPFSDFAGRHVLRISTGSEEECVALLNRLQLAGFILVRSPAVARAWRKLASTLRARH